MKKLIFCLLLLLFIGGGGTPVPNPKNTAQFNSMVSKDCKNFGKGIFDCVTRREGFGKLSDSRMNLTTDPK